MLRVHFPGVKSNPSFYVIPCSFSYELSTESKVSPDSICSLQKKLSNTKLFYFYSINVDPKDNKIRRGKKG